MVNSKEDFSSHDFKAAEFLRKQSNKKPILLVANKCDQPINEIDFTQFPLKAGDMVYIYSGYQGDYSHVLTVTRVDELRRAYSVTNNYTGDTEGFVILEYLLYDPEKPGEGIFYA